MYSSAQQRVNLGLTVQLFFLAICKNAYNCLIILQFYFSTVIAKCFTFWSSSLFLFSLMAIIDGSFLFKSSFQDSFKFLFFPFMFLTDEHQSTPFWCFGEPESSSHPPSHNLLCTHPTAKVSSAQVRGMQN